jgi:hypothetical protein
VQAVFPGDFHLFISIRTTSYAILKGMQQYGGPIVITATRFTLTPFYVNTIVDDDCRRAVNAMAMLSMS